MVFNKQGLRRKCFSKSFLRKLLEGNFPQSRGKRGGQGAGKSAGARELEGSVAFLYPGQRRSHTAHQHHRGKQAGKYEVE